MSTITAARTLLARFRAAAGTGARPDETSRPAPLHRRRGDYEGYMDYSNYDVWWGERFVQNPTGRYLTSRLANADYGHAPLLDIDRPVAVTPLADGAETRLHVPQMRAWAAARVARRLTAGGFTVAGYDPQPLTRLARTHPLRRVDAVYDLAFPMRLAPSKTSGHHHGFVEKAMSGLETEALVKALSEVVDKGWAQANLTSLHSIGLVLDRPGSVD